jgi:chromosome partitioning protein
LRREDPGADAVIATVSRETINIRRWVSAPAYSAADTDDPDGAGAPSLLRPVIGAAEGTAAEGTASAGPDTGPPVRTSSEFGALELESDLADTPIAMAARRAVEVQHGDLTLPRPRRRRVFTVANQKGGVGKTTTTVNIGVALALAGLHVLVIDLDPQGNASTALGADRKVGTPSTYDVLLGEIEAAEAIQTCREAPRLGVLPATIDLAGAEIELVTMKSRESRLKVAIDAIKGEYDYVFIDCPPSLGLLTVNAMVATEEVLVPIQCEYYALEGLGQLLTNIGLVQQHLNPGLEVSTILLTMYDGRTKLADQVADEVRRHFQDKVLRTVIPRSVKVSEAPGFGQSVITYDAGSRGSMAYLDAAREIAHRGAKPLTRAAAPSGPTPSGAATGSTDPAPSVQMVAAEPPSVPESRAPVTVPWPSTTNSAPVRVGISGGSLDDREASA